MRKPILTISTSDIYQFKDCLRRWNYQSNNRRNLEPLVPDRKLWLGTGVHVALKALYEHAAITGEWVGELLKPAFDAWADAEIHRMRQNLGALFTEAVYTELVESKELGQGILAHYEQWAQSADDDLRPLRVETQFEVPIPNTRINLTDSYGNWYRWVTDLYGTDPTTSEAFLERYNHIAQVDSGQEARKARVLEDAFAGTNADHLLGEVDKHDYTAGPPKQIWVPGLYVGTFDLIVQERRNPRKVWVMEHKTRAQSLPPDLLVLDEQTARYAWALNQMLGALPDMPEGVYCVGVIYNVLRKKVPRDPEPLQRGGLSKNKSIDTTAEVYKAAVLRAGYSLDDYADILTTLEAKGNGFFQRERVYRGPQELELVTERLTAEFNAMQRFAQLPFEDSPQLYPTPKQSCMWSCSFRNLCHAANVGADVEDLIQTQFRTAANRGAVYAHPDLFGGE